jgi:hypothetical protein
MKVITFVAPRLAALTIVLFVLFAAAGSVTMPAGDPQTPQEALTAAAALLFVCFLMAGVLTHLIIRSRWTGWRLMAAVFAVFYGVMTVMPQIESAALITRLPAGIVPRLFLMGAMIAAPFSLLAVLILGKWKAEIEVQAGSRLVMPASEWAWKVALIVILYVFLYFTFGYYVAWPVPEVREYYGGVDTGGYLSQLESIVRDTPWLVALQVGRALLWTAIALPVIRVLKGAWFETALALGALFAVTNFQLLLPNPYMPEAVRMAHLAETASSNFIFGVAIGWLLARPAVSAPQVATSSLLGT